MSMAPNNPFEPQPQPNAPIDQPKKKGSGWLWVFAIIGILGVIGAMVCCGGIYFAFQKGTGFLGEELQAKLDGNPVIEEHIGDVQSVSFSFQDTIKEAEKKEPDGDRMVFTIEGSKGSGKIIAKQDPERGLGDLELEMSDGSRHEITLDTPLFTPEGMEGFDIDDIEIDTGEGIQDMELEPVTVDTGA